MSDAFRHHDGDRTIVFGPGAVADAGDLLGDGYTLLTTARALAAAPSVAERAALVVEVPDGPVDAVAERLRGAVRGERLVALGGGRVIDVAKALAAADPPRTVAAIPTTLSGAEMTRVHRHARGVPDETPRARVTLVVNDPALSASQPLEELAASSANALGHVLVALASTRATPFSVSIARQAACRIEAAWCKGQPEREGLSTTWREGQPGRDSLALGALLAGWAVDHTGLGPHHAMTQTAVRVAGVAHNGANAALLPHTTASVRERRPEVLLRLDAELGLQLEVLAAHLCEWARGGLAPLADDEAVLERCVETASGRPELDRVPPPPDRDELRELYRRAAAPAAVA